MKRASYVDESGNPIDYSFQSKKVFLKIFFVIGTIIPLVLIGFIIYTMVNNSNCNQVYDSIKSATLEYLRSEGNIPDVDGESVNVNIGKLYTEDYLHSASTNNLRCNGKIKVTKYESELVYTLDVNSCDTCSVDNRYDDWSEEIGYYPANKMIVDVIPYYNYYERQVNVTDWSPYYEQDEIKKKESKYGVRLPKDDMEMPEIPTEGEIVEVQTEDILNYRYKDKTWLWYDIVGDYSDFSSEQPDGYANKDESTRIYTEWSEYSQNYPEEKEYRDIERVTGYKVYYEKDGEKVYANHGNYVALDDVDESVYDQRDSDTTDLYRYRDEMWRWYNGTKRRYSSYRSVAPNGYPYRDDDTERDTSYSSWDDGSHVTPENASYRTEETKTLTRYRYIYEILSLPVLKEPVTKEEFLKEINMTVPEFAGLEEYKLEVTYNFKYRKR